MTTTPPAYVFADDPTRADANHHGQLVNHLATVLDPFTIRRLTPLVHGSSRCLELAAGAGSIASWLADRASEVTATDLDPRHIPHKPHQENLNVIRHDLLHDPLEPGRYDLIHARLLLAHLPERREIVTEKLIPALAPGGVLVIEEFDPSWDRCVMHAPDPDAHRLFVSYHKALMSVLTSAGNDISWGRSVHQILCDAGLKDVDTELSARAWRGGQAGCMLPHTLSAQVRPKLVEAGMSQADITAFRTLLTDPRLLIYANLAVSTLGRCR